MTDPTENRDETASEGRAVSVICGAKIARLETASVAFAVSAISAKKDAPLNVENGSCENADMPNTLVIPW